MAQNFINLIFRLKSSCLSKEETIREEVDLSPAEFRAILSLKPGAEIPCSVFSRQVGLSVSRGSRVIDKLLKNGYSKSIKNKEDRRVMKIMLDTKGISVHNKIQKVLEECEHTIMKRMSKSELIQLESSLNKLSEILTTK